MDAMTRKYISVLAQRVMDTYDIKPPITDMEAVVRKFGGTIRLKEDFDEVCDGTIQKVGDNGFVIAISPFQSEQRKSFTIAHELGHLFLHMGFGTDINLWKQQNQAVYRRFGTTEQEYQANEFAASLLMPENQYKQVLDRFTQNDCVDMSKVAEYFKVSISAAINRGKFLGYLA